MNSTFGPAMWQKWRRVLRTTFKQKQMETHRRNIFERTLSISHFSGDGQHVQRGKSSFDKSFATVFCIGIINHDPNDTGKSFLILISCVPISSWTFGEFGLKPRWKFELALRAGHVTKVKESASHHFWAQTTQNIPQKWILNDFVNFGLRWKLATCGWTNQGFWHLFGNEI